MTTKMDWENILYTAEMEGEERGRAEGREIGTRQALVETARRMVEQLGYSPEQAAEATGLSNYDSIREQNGSILFTNSRK